MVLGNTHLTNTYIFSLSEYLQLVYRTSNTRINGTLSFSADNEIAPQFWNVQVVSTAFWRQENPGPTVSKDQSPRFLPVSRSISIFSPLVILRLHLCKTIVLYSGEATLNFHKCREGKKIRRVLFASQLQAWVSTSFWSCFIPPCPWLHSAWISHLMTSAQTSAFAFDPKSHLTSWPPIFIFSF